MRISFFIYIVVTVVVTGISTTLLHAQEGDRDTALLVIDVQNFYFHGGDAELVEPEKAAENVALLEDHFRKSNQVIIHVRHNYEPGGEIHECVQPIPGEKVISKDHANAFRETDLLVYLRQNKIKNLVITGMQTHMCVEATTRAAADYGFNCIVIDDACATRDLKYGDKIVRSTDVHYSTLATLKSGYAKIMTTEEYLGSKQ